MENNTLDLLINEFTKILEEKKEPINFYVLFETACKNLNIDKNNIDLMSDAYYKIMLLKEFLLVGKNEWALRKFYKYQTIKKFNDETMKIEKDTISEDSENLKEKHKKIAEPMESVEEEIIDDEIIDDDHEEEE